MGRDKLAVEAYLSACLGAIRSALLRLKEEVDAPTYKATLARWYGMLSPLEQDRFERMRKLRNLDVHETDVPTTAKTRPVQGLLVPGATVVGQPGLLVSALYVDADEAPAACEKFLILAERLVAEFQGAP